jgi:heme/copper-type cytochrome/quinol oxidase subunit 3
VTPPVVFEAPPERPPVARRPDGPVLPPEPPSGGGDGHDREPSERRPALDNLRLAILFLIGCETMFFAALISALFVLRLGQPLWPPPFQPRLPVGVTGVNTLVLLASSVTLSAAIRALTRGEEVRAVRRLAVTAGLGLLFLLVQGYEWARLIGYGLTVSSGTYGTTFYTLIGTHGLHVLGALCWLGVTLVLASRGRYADGRTAPVRACAMFWHFVVGLWPILYVAVYLL